MTDNTPVTEAGRLLLNRPWSVDPDVRRVGILAIEAEAAQARDGLTVEMLAEAMHDVRNHRGTDQNHAKMPHPHPFDTKTAAAIIAALPAEAAQARDPKAFVTAANQTIKRLNAELAAAQARDGELRSIVNDCIYGLRNQPELSREEIADVLARALIGDATIGGGSRDTAEGKGD